MKARERARFVGRWKLEVVRDGKVIHEEVVNNRIVNDGANSILNASFRGGTQVNPWYVGLVDNGGFSAFNDADLMNAHAGWVESIAYSEAARQTWSPGAASGRSLTNASAFVFTVNAPCTIYGVFVASDNTKSGTTGTLLSEAAFSAPRPYLAGDLIRLVYTISC